MIYLGTDIINIDRIRKSIRSIKFLSKIFTKNEIKYCQLKLDPAVHFAGRFAGKEAVKKAVLSSGVLESISMKDIEILSNQTLRLMQSDDQKYQIESLHTQSSLYY